MKCLLAAASIDAQNSKVHEQTVRFKQALDGDLDNLNTTSLAIIKSEFMHLEPSTSLSEFNDEYLSKNKDSVRRVISGLKVRRQLSPNSASSCEKELAALIKQPSIIIDDAVEALLLLKSWKSSELEAFKIGAAARWPNATIFQS